MNTPNTPDHDTHETRPPADTGVSVPPPQPIYARPEVHRLWAALRLAVHATNSLKATLDRHVCRPNSRGFCDDCGLSDGLRDLGLERFVKDAISRSRLYVGDFPIDIVDDLEAELERLIPNPVRIGGEPAPAIEEPPAEELEKPAPIDPRVKRWQAFHRHAARAVIALEILGRATRQMRRLHREHEGECPRKGQEVGSCRWCGAGTSAPDCCYCEGIRLLDLIDVDTWSFAELAEQLGSATEVSACNDAVRQLERACDKLAH